MLLTVLGLLDVLLGGVLAASPYISYAASGMIFTLAILAVIKGVYSMLTSMAAGWYMDVLGWLDLLVGILLLLATWGINFNWFFWIGIFMALKGVYSIATEMVGD